MRFFLLALFFTGFISESFSQAPNWLWANEGSNTGYGYSSGLAMDTSGNLYMSGRTGGGALNFVGKTIAPGGTVPFDCKVDASGNGIFLTSNYSVSGFAYADAICVDRAGNSFITSCDGSGDAVYVQGFNGNGNLVWTLNSSNSNCRGYGIVADNFGNVYSSGHYTGSSITFGGTNLPNNGAYSGYLLKQDTAGNVKWATYMNATGGTYTSAKHVATDKNGNVYVCGAYQGAATFYSAGGGASITAPTSVATGGFSDFFLAEYDSTGKVLWVTTAANAGLSYNSYYYSNVLAVDSCGNVYAGGIFQNTAQFGNISITSTGGQDVFVGKFNTLAQQWEWVQPGGSGGTDYLGGIALDKNSDVYIEGSYASTPATFGSGSLSSGNAFVVKYANSNGDVQWAQSATCNGVGGIVVDKQGFVYISGGANTSSAWGSVTPGGVSPGGNGLFIAKLDTVPIRTIVPTVLASYCPGSSSTISYTITGTFNAGNVFTAQLSNDSGSFNAPVTLGTTTSTTSGTINITIPAGTPVGSQYLIRVVSSNPATSSFASGCGLYLINNVYVNNVYVSIGGGLNAKVTPADTTYCSGSSVQITATGGNSYSWLPTAGLSCSTCANPLAQPTQNATYTVSISSGGSCPPASLTSIINVTPAVNLTVSPTDTSVCSGSALTLNASGATTYSWSPAIGLTCATCASITLTSDTTVTYSVTGANGICSGTNQITVQVGNVAVGGMVTAIRDTICQGTPGNLAVAGGTTNNLQWQSSVNDSTFNDISGATSSTYKTSPLLTTTWYRVTAGSAGCSATSDTLQLYIPPPLTAYFNYSLSVANQLSFYSDSSSGRIRSYHWDFGDGITSNDSNPSHAFAKDTTYYVCLTLYDGSNCSYTFCRYSAVTDGIPTIAATGNWIIYPNPFSGQLTVSGKHGSNQVQSIQMFDVLGRLVINKNLGSSTNTSLQLDVSALAKGMYYVMIRTADADYVQKVVKQ